MTSNFSQKKRVFAALADAYLRLEGSISTAGQPCSACGRCCDFSKVDFQLWATRLEVEYMVAHGGKAEGINPRACRYLDKGGRCLNRTGRVLGCRVYFCRQQPGVMSESYERALKEIRRIHNQFDIEWDYADVLSLQKALVK